MLPPGAALLWALVLAAGSPGLGAQRPPQRPPPISAVQPKAGFDAQQVAGRLCGEGQARRRPSALTRPPQFAGTWFLAAVASSCRFLQEQGHRAEATAVKVAPQGKAMAVNTFQKL